MKTKTKVRPTDMTDEEIAAEVATWPPLSEEAKLKITLLMRPVMLAMMKAKRA